MANGGSLILIGNLGCSFRQPFGGEFFVKKVVIEENTVFDRAVARMNQEGITGLNFVVDGMILTFKDKNELKEYIELARKLKTPYIRILGDEKAAVDGEVDDAVVLAALKTLAPIAEEAGVCLLVETNGVYADTNRLKNLLCSDTRKYKVPLIECLRTFCRSTDTYCREWMSHG